MKYCFGPVPSRRLGLSLGVDILPLKTCNLNCIYCELGRSASYTCERSEYIPAEEIKKELEAVVSGGIKFDTLTFTASGEPTLHLRLGELLRFAKGITDCPVAVLTNATLLSDPAVRADLTIADIILPSLDSVIPRHFRKVNRPALCVKLEAIVEGLVRLRREMTGRMWLEVLLVQGINDSPQDIEALKEVIKSIMPDRVQLNTVSRPPAEHWARPVSEERLRDIQIELGETAEVIAGFKGSGGVPEVCGVLEVELMEMLKRRPLTIEDISSLTRSGVDILKEALRRMERDGSIKCKIFGGRPFYFPSDRVE
ncbi:MAG: radical SAM protein [Dissulfurimicrobium sp.]|uniref:radical SAM protein n=1 Tax=Dissulfurimicrobium TaxID=1769732 RepID=UPI001EDB6EA8|nr:radical SAM protein [Dissulfurimicrobium hydrothermale]UKL13748.1 radical SAM protein [Dissulfurimicrobium hydrothermale]